MKPRDRTEYLRKYREAHREEAKAYARRYRAEHPDKTAASKRATYLKNRPKRLAAMQAWSAAQSAEAKRARKTAWRTANPDKALVIDAKILLATAAKCRILDLPPVLIEAKTAQLKVLRALRGAKK